MKNQAAYIHACPQLRMIDAKNKAPSQALYFFRTYAVKAAQLATY
jgi:hypothetical protein